MLPTKVALAIMFLPGNILLDITPKAFKHALPKSLDAYDPIDSHNISQFKHIGPISSPESIAYFDRKLVTGSADGYIYQILSDDSLKKLVKVCESKNEKEIDSKSISRPLGLQFDSKGVLFVVEPYLGIFKVENIFTNKPKVSKVFDIQETVKLDIASKFLDDVAVEEKPNGNHVLYISDVSTKFTLEEFMLILFGSEKGRLIRYDIESKEIEVVSDQLFFPNGVEMAQDNQAVLFVEWAARKAWKYNLKGDKRGTLEQIFSTLPGEPDNIRRSASGDTYWIALLKPRTMLQPTEFDYFMKKPLLRKMIARTYHLAGNVLSYINLLWPSDKISQLSHDLKTLNFEVLPGIFTENGGMLLEIDINGNVLTSIYSDQENLNLISEIREVESVEKDSRVLYLGSFSSSSVRKLVFKK